MKKLKIAALFLVVIIIISCFCGCQLKKTPDEANSEDNDKLIGAIITTESLNTFDIESYLQNNIGTILNKNGATEIKSEDMQYQNKIYARLDSIETTDEDGTKTEHKEYVFDDIDGFWLFDATISDGNNYSCLCSNGAFSDIHSKVSQVDDNVSEIELTANIYYSPKLNGAVFYMNPVYQESDGDVYAVEGTGYSVYDETGYSPGNSRGSQKLADEIKINNNGEETVYKSVIEIGYIPVNTPEKVSFIFMDDDNKALSELSFKPNDVPKEIKVPEGVRYIITEESIGNSSKVSVVGKGEESAEFICEEKDGICTKNNVNLIW